MVRAFDAVTIDDTVPTSTGTKDFVASGVGGTPIGALVVISGNTSIGSVEGHDRISYGLCDATEQLCVSQRSQFNVATSNCRTYSNTDRVGHLINVSADSADIVAEFDSFITDGIRLDFTTVDGSAYRITVLLFFGSDSDCAIWAQTSPLSATQDETIAVGFEPELNIILSSLDEFSGTYYNGISFGIGLSSNEGGSDKNSLALPLSEDNLGTSATYFYRANDESARYVEPGFSPALGFSTGIFTYTSTGFTIDNVDENISPAPKMGGLAIRCASASVKLDTNRTMPTSAPTTVNNPTGWKSGLALFINESATANGISGQSFYSLGLTDFRNGSRAYHLNDRFGVTTTIAGCRFDNDRVVSLFGPNGTVNQKEADVANNISTGFDIEFTTADSGTRKYSVLAIEELPFTGSSSGTLPSLGGSASASQVFSGSAGGSLPSLSGAASATEAFSGSASGSLGSLQGSASAELQLSASATGSLGAPQGSASASLDFSATASGALSSLAGASVASTTFTSSASGSLPSLSGTSLGAVGFSGSGTGSLPGLGGTSTAQQVFSGSGSGALAALAGSAQAATVFQSTATGSLPALAGEAQGELVLGVDASASGSIPSLQGASTAAQLFLAAATGSTPSLTGSASGSVILVTAPFFGVMAGAAVSSGPLAGAFSVQGPLAGSHTYLGTQNGVQTISGPCAGSSEILPQIFSVAAIISDAFGSRELTGTVDSCKRLNVDLCWVRGDDGRSVSFTFYDDEASTSPTDWTGASAKLVVDPAPDPSNTDNNLFEITGTFNVPATDGVITFTPSKSNSLQTPGVYFYDVQVLLASGKYVTVAKGQWTVEADIADAGS